MKIQALVIVLCFVGSVHAQTETRTEKKFQRFENGELVEDNYYLEENGRVIEGQDFEMPEMDQMQTDMDVKMAEMQQRMAEMNRRMEEMKRRSIKMQEEMELKMYEQKMPQLNKSETPSSVGTTYRL